MDTFHKQAGDAIEAGRAELAEAIVERQYQAQPDLAARYGERGRAKCLQDSMHHLSSISSALALATPDIFVDYVVWAKGLLEARNIPAEDLAINLTCIRDVLHDSLPGDLGTLAVEYVEAGLGQLPQTQHNQT